VEKAFEDVLALCGRAALAALDPLGLEGLDGLPIPWIVREPRSSELGEKRLLMFRARNDVSFLALRTPRGKPLGLPSPLEVGLAYTLYKAVVPTGEEARVEASS